jgi:hypothetical protein
MVGKPLGVFRTAGWLRVTPEDLDGNPENGEIPEEEKAANNYNVGDVRHSYWSESEKRVVGDDYGYGWVGVPRQDPTLQVAGDPNPDFMLSWRNDFTFFQDLTVSFLFDGVFGFDVWNGTQGALYNFGTHGDTEDREEPWVNKLGNNVYDYNNYDYDPEDPSTGDPSGPEYANPVDKTEKYWTYYNGFLINEPHIEDGSFIKLREVVVEYRWHGLKDWDISTVTFSFAARNLLTITDYSGYDPEVNTFSLAEGRGMDYFTLPQMRSYRFGITINY